MLTHLFLSSSLSLFYCILAVPMRKCLEKHSCRSSSFPIVILNDTSFFPTVQLQVHNENPARYGRNTDALVNRNTKLNWLIEWGCCRAGKAGWSGGVLVRLVWKGSGEIGVLVRWGWRVSDAVGVSIGAEFLMMGWCWWLVQKQWSGMLMVGELWHSGVDWCRSDEWWWCHCGIDVVVVTPHWVVIGLQVYVRFVR